MKRVHGLSKLNTWSTWHAITSLPEDIHGQYEKEDKNLGDLSVTWRRLCK